MRELSTFFSLAAVAIMLGYIVYNESRSTTSSEVFSDNGVVEPAMGVAEDGTFTAVAYDLPSNAVFAGEEVPLQIPDVRERLDKEIQINSYLHSNTIFLIKRAHRWLPQMQKILAANGIPDDFKYLPLIESNLMNVTSPKEAVGYWQILSTSGKEYGLEITKEVDERFDPIKSTVAACKYLKASHRKFGNWTLVAASYNRGMAGIDRAIDNQLVKSYYDLYLNDETSRYVFRMVAIKEIIENPARYGFKIDVNLLYKEEPLRYVDVTETIKDLVDFSNAQGINYKLLKRHNPWLREEKLTVKKGKSYRIAIPVQ
jgi:membrane-bound lytic murein transglycosylase D